MIWIGVALVFNVIVYLWMGSEAALQFATGYIIERALSFDNLFVFLLIFSYFKVPALHQYRVLFWGIVAALILRGIFVISGIELIERFHWLIYVFGAFLILTGIKIAFQGDKEADLGRNPFLRLCRRFLPTTEHYHGESFFVIREGRLLATPLFLVLLVVEASDIIFALDSVPAILGITLNPFIVYTSNVFSILGLRALYFALAGCLMIFHYLSHGITIILIFVGTKMLLTGFYEVPAEIALGVVALVLLASILLSILKPHGESHEQAAGKRPI
jgi:tellurite resistance protein TerC